ncbi:MAG: anthranilate phosphoribosyltransferase [Actinomycetota bacterium]|nr:anthranilate phosphoribosyltransferase [Actinomycetota bacterium]
MIDVAGQDLAEGRDPASVLFDTLGAWPGVLGRLAGGQDLMADEAAAALADILAGNAAPSQIAAFIFGLRCKGETVDEMTGLVRAMLAAAERVVVDPVLTEHLVDTCGTGGDRSGTINVSTIAALVLAGAGVPVCKHGGRASSSRAGSADVLETLGVAIDLGPAQVRRCIQEVGIGFCYAPRYHPAMRHAVPIRRELGVATAFNFLGPLANPARLRRQVVGVGDPAMATKVCGVLAANGAAHVLVVYGSDGLDELTTTGPSTIVEWIADPSQQASAGAGGGAGLAGTTTTSVIDAAELGLARARPADLLGGDVDTNARMALAVLGGEQGAQRDLVVLNAAAGLVAGGVVAHLADGLLMAGAVIDDGRALSVLQRLITVSNALTP